MMKWINKIDDGQHRLSQNIGLAIAGSARPASPALSERKECVKETWVKLFHLQVQISKAYEKSGAAQAAPASLLLTAMHGYGMSLMSSIQQITWSSIGFFVVMGKRYHFRGWPVQTKCTHYLHNCTCTLLSLSWQMKFKYNVAECREERWLKLQLWQGQTTTLLRVLWPGILALRIAVPFSSIGSFRWSSNTVNSDGAWNMYVSMQLMHAFHACDTHEPYMHEWSVYQN